MESASLTRIRITIVKLLIREIAMLCQHKSSLVQFDVAGAFFAEAVAVFLLWVRGSERTNLNGYHAPHPLS